MPTFVPLLQGDLVAGAGESGVGAQPASEDLGEAVAVVAGEADDVEGDFDEVGFVGGAVDLHRGGARGQARVLLAVREEQDGLAARVGDLAEVRGLPVQLALEAVDVLREAPFGSRASSWRPARSSGSVAKVVRKTPFS
jgi:hypothetical protein